MLFQCEFFTYIQVNFLFSRRNCETAETLGKPIITLISWLISGNNLLFKLKRGTRGIFDLYCFQNLLVTRKVLIKSKITNLPFSYIKQIYIDYCVLRLVAQENCMHNFGNNDFILYIQINFFFKSFKQYFGSFQKDNKFWV